MARFESDFNRTPTIGVGFGFVNVEGNARELLDAKVIGTDKPAAVCAAGSAITLEAILNQPDDSDEAFYLDVMRPGTEELLVLQNP